jgi:hypothetical protein
MTATQSSKDALVPRLGVLSKDALASHQQRFKDLLQLLNSDIKTTKHEIVLYDLTKA